MKQGIKGFLLIAGAYAVGFLGAAAATVFSSGRALIASGVYIIVFLLQALVIRSTRPQVMQRRLLTGGEAGQPVTVVIALLGAAAMIVAAVEVKSGVQALPEWCMYLGMVLFLTGHFVAVSTLNATPPHCNECYGEEKEEGAESGSYDVIRHPMALAIICIVASIPLVFGTVYAFIPAAATFVACIVWVAIKDQWRFVNYNWYYDYTQRVSYRIIPYIW